MPCVIAPPGSGKVGWADAHFFIAPKSIRFLQPLRPRIGLWQDWPHVSIEIVLARAPEAVVLIRGGKVSLDVLKEKPDGVRCRR